MKYCSFFLVVSVCNRDGHLRKYESFSQRTMLLQKYRNTKEAQFSSFGLKFFRSLSITFLTEAQLAIMIMPISNTLMIRIARSIAVSVL